MRISLEAEGPFERLRLLHARVVRDSVALVERVTPGDLGRTTPCAGWTVADLLAHMTAQHRGFAAAALGDGAELAHWSVHPVTDTADAVARYAEAAEHVVAAFAALGGPDRPFLLPEFTVDRTFPAGRAVGFHFIDYVVHGWDMARGLDLPYDPDADILDAALPIALSVPDGATRLSADSPFRPGIPLPPGAGTLDRILAALGRHP
ncbi:TIGR03086 family metal-binding protein [Streptomyces sp. NPDC056527]|uniref:TIGR03086 family metal-binding protein n=1 Tax=Streptomyces sp. NPDC056527 TaxID=3345853 RepID=UPI0036C23908